MKHYVDGCSDKGQKWRNDPWAAGDLKYACTCVYFRYDSLQANKGCENCHGHGYPPIPAREVLR